MSAASPRTPRKPQQAMGTKWLAGTLLGLPLAVALCALSVIWLPGGWESGAIGALLACLPLWVAIICASVLFATSRAAWLCLAAGNLAAFGLLWAWRLLLAPGAA
ncbi:hypothetical protein P3W85_44955 [Cupriavidus basilensis]|uniref:Transmembrane lipoprotein n=1 Tax=Cupriavidus basilensis TaxID=68895 RepID=A0ABT6B6Z0_9BURK|nr:hypothetical protein [Cupriavidus basilensis]MDF3840026.1 hypothetical protein [Cupriavidus basilensis]